MKSLESSTRIFRRYPVFLAPLLAVWAVYAPTVLSLKYGVHWNTLSTRQSLALILAAVALLAFMLAVSCSVLLELIEQVECGLTPRLGRAAAATARSNLLRMLPLVVVWTVLWFALALVQALLSRRRRKAPESFSAASAARTLTGYSDFSLSAAFMGTVQKGVRMVVFLILPGIAWENLGFLQATRKGFALFRAHNTRFAEGFARTELVKIALFVPPVLLGSVSRLFDVVFPSAVWTLVIAYVGLAWSYAIYLEQMFAAELYLWNLKWERAVELRKSRGKRLPKLDDVRPPRLLDDVHELA